MLFLLLVVHSTTSSSRIKASALKNYFFSHLFCRFKALFNFVFILCLSLSLSLSVSVSVSLSSVFYHCGYFDKDFLKNL